jgi:hypothetical protein
MKQFLLILSHTHFSAIYIKKNLLAFTHWRKKMMVTWTYRIQAMNGCILTKNAEYAEQKSKHGYRVFCKRDSSIPRYP